MRKMGMMGSKAGMIAKDQAAQPMMSQKFRPGGGSATPKAAKPQAAEMGSGGLKGGISALRSNHAMRGPGKGGKMV